MDPPEPTVGSFISRPNLYHFDGLVCFFGSTLKIADGAQGYDRIVGGFVIM